MAQEQLAKVQVAWLDPTDWSDLTIYGMHAYENAVVAAAEALKISVKKTHWDKAEVADRLHKDHNLPDIADLLQELNELRKGFAYGELTIDPSMSAEDIAGAVEHYLDAVSDLLERSQT